MPTAIAKGNCVNLYVAAQLRLHFRRRQAFNVRERPAPVIGMSAMRGDSMEFAIRLLGAFVVTYLFSRLLFRAFGARSVTALLPIIGVHLLSLAALAVSVAWIRAYSSDFAWEAALPYLAPQLFWLLIDAARLRR
jgi:hypothetical protein